MAITAQDWYRSRPWVDEPNADIDAYCRSVARPEDYDLRAKLDYWREHGVVIFEQAIDTKLIDLLSQDLDDLIRSPGRHQIEIENAGTHVPVHTCTPEMLAGLDRLKFNNLHSASLAACHLSLSRVVTSFLHHIFQSPPCVLQSLTFNKGSQQPIHLDYPYVQAQQHISRMAASWIPLEDVHPDSGPLAYYCGSQKPEILPFFDWGSGSITMTKDTTRQPIEFSNYLTAEMKRLAIPPKVFLPRRGDVLIWHAYLAHEGLPITDPSRTRRSYVTHYAPLDSYPPDHMKPKALAHGHYMSCNGGYAFDLPWYHGPTDLPSEGVLPRARDRQEEPPASPIATAVARGKARLARLFDRGS